MTVAHKYVLPLALGKSEKSPMVNVSYYVGLPSTDTVRPIVTTAGGLMPDSSISLPMSDKAPRTSFRPAPLPLRSSMRKMQFLASST
jgi:hypothetical protein